MGQNKGCNILKNPILRIGVTKKGSTEKKKEPQIKILKQRTHTHTHTPQNQPGKANLRAF